MIETKGYYNSEQRGKGLGVPIGRLSIEVRNMLEFRKLVEQAKTEADQLKKTIDQLQHFELNIDFINTTEFEIALREDCKLSFNNKVFKLELGRSGYGRDMRAVEIESVNAIRIFSDNSSLEIFLNNGEEVFSTRIYNDSVDTALKLRGNGSAIVEKWNF